MTYILWGLGVLGWLIVIRMVWQLCTIGPPHFEQEQQNTQTRKLGKFLDKHFERDSFYTWLWHCMECDLVGDNENPSRLGVRHKEGCFTGEIIARYKEGMLNEKSVDELLDGWQDINHTTEPSTHHMVGNTGGIDYCTVPG
ncbi:hypothetical protein LCGC14_3139470 [marine sediment metagenome]|uniref:Uncharacterized protein n=1 Tax=marine sediment metagenome TaxID=412755 RepID=A0A0F8VX96_9ZZZZ